MIHKLTTDSVNIYFQEIHDLPIIDIQLNFKAGSAFDDKLNGLANLATGLFATKTRHSSEQELINKITDLGISIYAEVNKEYFTIKIRLLSEPTILEQTIALLREIFASPDFDKNILEREIIQTLTHIDYLHKQPSYLAALEFDKHLFANNPYSHPTTGYKDSIKKITIANINNFYDKYICVENTNICIVGDIDKTNAQKISQEIINSLSKGQKNIQNFSQASIKSKIIKKHFSSKQTSILMGHQLLMEISDPLYFPLKLGNEILGGNGLNSLFFNKVREELGLVYNIQSSANINPGYGNFIISAQTSNPKLALETIKKVYNNFIYEKINEETLKNTKKHIEGVHLLASITNSSKLNLLSSIANKELSLDFFDKYVGNINAVTTLQINQAFQKIQENELVTIMIGNIK